MRKCKTVKEAAELWFSMFDCFPTSMLERLHKCGERFVEVTATGKKYSFDFPMWDCMWQFGEQLDKDWLETQGGLATMLRLGFSVYWSPEWGYFFGIEGGGYDFYTEHWIPLYLERGLHWHEESSSEYD